jgi:2,2-dialkylglycine decarboxylase (pyruvate)
MAVPTATNKALWQQYGDYILMAMPYADEVLVEGRGCRVRDADGNELLDLAAGMFCCVLGHNHPEFVERIAAQAHQLVHTGSQFLSPAVMRASAKLAQVTPGRLRKSILFSTGTEANEFAFRLAKAYTGRTGIVGFSHGYYGTSLATRSCSALTSRHRPDSLPTLPECARIPITPQCRGCFTDAAGDCDFPCLDTLESWLGAWNNIAAVIVEPVLSAGGMLLPPPGYLQRLAQMTREHGALFIVDEAQTGFGRTGTWFAIEHHGVEPDILSLSKSLGNGFPAAAVITTAEIADQTVRDGLWHLSSHQSEPMAAAAIEAVIDIVASEGLLERAREQGDYFMAGLRRLAEKNPAVRSVRGQGLMIGFDLVAKDPETAPQFTTAFVQACRRRGVHLTFSFGNTTIRVIPPLIIGRDDIDLALEVIAGSLEEAERDHGAQNGLPANPYVRRVYRNRPLEQIFNWWWRSSPQKWAEKTRTVLKSRIGRA